MAGRSWPHPLPNQVSVTGFYEYSLFADKLTRGQFRCELDDLQTIRLVNSEF